MQQKSGRSIQSVQRAIDIINCFDSINTELTLGQISSMLNLNKSTVHGILNTLYQNDFVRQTPSGHYMMGSYFVRRLGSTDASIRTLMKAKARDGMTRIANKYGASCGLFMLDLGELVLVNRIQPQNESYAIITYTTYIQPLYCSASGKILLASMGKEELDKYLSTNPLVPRTEKTITSQHKLMDALEAVRREGYGIENEELGQGVYALSAPILSKEGKLFATVSVTGLTLRMRSKTDVIVADLKALSQEISQHLF
ncbi:MAG: IclR family transcriptional regulator [Lawsonibacter sp.]